MVRESTVLGEGLTREAFGIVVFSLPYYSASSKTLFGGYLPLAFLRLSKRASRLAHCI